MPLSSGAATRGAINPVLGPIASGLTESVLVLEKRKSQSVLDNYPGGLKSLMQTS